MRTVASAKGKGSRGRPCPCPAVPHTTHAHARAPSVPGSGKVRDSKTATLYTNRASPRPKQQLANAPSRTALLSRAPPLVASRNVTTPTSTPLGRNPAPLSSQPLWPLPCPHLPSTFLFDPLAPVRQIYSDSPLPLWHHPECLHCLKHWFMKKKIHCCGKQGDTILEGR